MSVAANAGRPVMHRPHPTDLWGRVTDRVALLDVVHQPGQVDASLVAEIQTASDEVLVGTSHPDPMMARLVRVGALVIAEAWEVAHRRVQDIESVRAFYWHGILHRREPDAGNARYWFRRVPSHPVFQTHPVFQKMGNLDYQKRGVASSVFNSVAPNRQWNPEAFLSRHTHCAQDPRHPDVSGVRILQQCDILALLEYCRQAACR